MPQDLRLPRRSTLRVLLVLLAGFFLVFAVPFHIPVAPSISDSYTFGFNNRAALALFVLFAFGFAWWSDGLGLRAAMPEDAPVAPPMSRRLFHVTLGITAAVTLTFWLAYRSVGAINEGAYLMDRLQHLAAGETMYRDFEFIYGPVLLEIPLQLHRLLHLSLLDAYFLSWIIDWIVGVWLLWITVAWTCATSLRKNGIYLLAFLGFIFSTVSLGLNYTPLRFVAAPFFAAAIWRVLSTRRSALPAALLSLPCAAFILFYSPEQGIAFCAGTLLFFLLFVSRSHQQSVPAIAVLLVGEAVLLALLLHSGVVHYIRGMAAGGYNLPLLPSFNTLIELLLLLVAICVLTNSLRAKSTGGPLEYLILIALGALPAAFGRCDGGHMFMNTVGAFLVAWTVLSHFKPAAKWMVWSYIAGALFLPLALYQANNFFMFPVKAALFSPADPHPALRRFAQSTLHRALGAHRSEATLAKWRTAYPVTVPSNVPRDQALLAPLGYPSTLLLGDLPPITNGRYRGLGNVMAPYEVQEKVDELRDHPQAMLLFTHGTACPAADPHTAPTTEDVAAEDRQKRHELFLNLLPFYVPHVQHRDDFLAPVCTYITAHYQPAPYTAPLEGAEIWQRKPGP